MNMKKVLFASAATAVLALTSLTANAQDKDPKVGGADMYPTKTIVENAVNSPIHKTLVAAVKAAGLVDTLNSPGPFTVFAPTDAAFGKLPAGTVDTLVKPESKETLTKILTYHVVPGRISTMDLDKAIKDGGGKATMNTVEGEPLTFTGSGKKITITDAKGGKAMITTANVYQSNGVIQVIDAVLMP
jgi:uncharacterized surface protein with fasciclin (FAS1) repeats